MFERWIWIFIILSALGVAFLLRIGDHSPQNWFAMPSFLISSLQIFLEQGNSFFDKAPVRIKSGPYILMGIVISNAYKNTNVYDMISPRKAIPYETFRELVTDNFSVFTRVVALEVDVHDIGLDDVAEAIISGKGSVVEVIRNGLKVIIVSEVADVAGVIVQAQRNGYQGTLNGIDAIEESTLVKSGVRNGSSLHPWSADQGENIHHRMQRLLDAVTDDTEIIKLGLEFGDAARIEDKTLRKFDTKILEDVMLGCNKAAIILRHHLCRELARKLKKKKKLTHVFIGKESYSPVEWMLTLDGVIPSHIPKRIKGSHEAGLWERWPKLEDRSYTEASHGSNEHLVTAARMDGNVVVIFIVFLSALMVSIFVAVVEFGYNRYPQIGP